MKLPPLHIGVAESTQSADVEHVVTTAVVATMVFPVKGIVEDIARGLSPQHQRERAPYVCSVRHEAALSPASRIFSERNSNKHFFGARPK